MKNRRNPVYGRNLFASIIAALLVSIFPQKMALSAEINDLNQVDANNTARFPEGQSPGSVNDAARALEGIIARFYGDIGGRVTTTGTATAYAYAATQAISALYDGLILTFDAHTTNTGSATLAVDGLSATTLKKHNDQNLAAGDIEAGQKVMVVYDGTNFQLLSGLANAPLTAVSGDTAPTLGGNLAGGGYAISNLSSIAATAISEGVTRVALVGRRTVWIPAGAMVASATSGAASARVQTTATRPDLNVLDFDPSTREHAQFNVAFPKSWDNSTLKYQYYWTETSGSSTAGVVLGVQCVAAADGDTIDVAYGTAVTAADNAQSTSKDLLISAESSPITVAGSPGAGELTFCQVYRDVSDSGDTFAADMRLLGLKLFYTTTSGNDS